MGAHNFARSPDSDGWVSFYDLPEATCDELWRKIRSGELCDSFRFYGLAARSLNLVNTRGASPAFGLNFPGMRATRGLLKTDHP